MTSYIQIWLILIGINLTGFAGDRSHSESLLNESAQTAFARFQEASDTLRSRRQALCPRKKGPLSAEEQATLMVCIEENEEEWEAIATLERKLRRACMIPPPEGERSPRDRRERRKLDFSHFSPADRKKIEEKLTQKKCATIVRLVKGGED